AGRGGRDARDQNGRPARGRPRASAVLLRPRRGAAAVVTELEFIVADPSSPAWRSPLRRALADAPEWIRDVSALVDDATVAALGPAAGVAGIELAGARAPRLLRR